MTGRLVLHRVSLAPLNGRKDGVHADDGSASFPIMLAPRSSQPGTPNCGAQWFCGTCPSTNGNLVLWEGVREDGTPISGKLVLHAGVGVTKSRAGQGSSST
jgi:hypothetical protein